MTRPSAPNAGGRATEAGMSFQAMVGTWFAAHLAADMPVGSRFGLMVDLRPLELQFETGDALDDAVLRLTDGGTIYVQCKTHPGLERGADSALGKTIAQLVAFVVDQRAKAPPIDPSRTAAVLAVAEGAPRSLDALEDACRQFDRGETWSSVIGRVSEAQRTALDTFRLHANRAWNAKTNTAITDDDLVELAKFFRIRRFGTDAASSDWRETISVIGSRLYEGTEFGGPPTFALLDIVRQLIRSGASANRLGLARALRSAGYPEARAPGFDHDVAALVKYTRDECERLARHAVLEADRRVPVARECLPALKAAIEGGSLLVIGEPGAGKTGVLVTLAGQIRQQSTPLVFLSVDRLASISSLSALKDELGLQHDLLEVLAAWPGDTPGILIIDALDASRGGSSETAFASLIELALPRIGARWSIVASIRTFDLMNGRRFREAMRGDAPNPTFAEQRLRGARHFLIKALSPVELAEIGRDAPQLGELIKTAPSELMNLLKNIFNLSLAGELIKGGVAAANIRTVTTQSELIDRYEDQRLPTQPLKRAVSAAITAMVASRRLSVPQIDVQHDALDGVLQAGVLVRAGDLIAFAHHVLFDHIAGRYYLAWSDIDRLTQQVSSGSGTGLLLGPALRFAMERIWQDDDVARSQSWKLLNTITSSTHVDPIVASIALRTIAERVESEADIQGLVAALRTTTDQAVVGSMLSRLARFVGMTLTEGVRPAVGRAWSAVAEGAARLGDRNFADGARFLLWSLSERAAFDDASFAAAFGSASRALLRLAWSVTPSMSSITIAAIRCVAKSYGSDPSASRMLLQQILEEPRFFEHAHAEAPWLAEGVRYIIPHDPSFVATIYATLFARPAPQDGKSWFGGHASRILPLTTDRKQEYEHAHWHLNRSIQLFLETAPKEAVAAVIGAANGTAAKGRRRDGPDVLRIEVNGKTICVVDDVQSLQDWRQEPRRGTSSEDDVLGAFVNFLSKTEVGNFRMVVEATAASEAGATVWARVFRIASERLGVADDLLWPIASAPAFASIRGLARDAVIYLQKVYPLRSVGEREAFEIAVLGPQLLEDTPAGNWWRSLLARWLSEVPEEMLATSEMKSFRERLASEDRLRGNPPFVSIHTGWGPADDITDALLARNGVDLEREPDHSLRAAAKALEGALKSGRGTDVRTDIPKLWRMATAVVGLIDSAIDPLPHVELLHSSWGAVSEAIEQLAKDEAYDPAQEGHPDLGSLLALNTRLGQSQYPEPIQAENEGSLMAWGNWDVRVYAASSATRLAQRFANIHPAILDDLDTFVRDPVRTVRLQIAESVNCLWDVARERMWELADYVAKNEPSKGVLAHFIGGPLHRIVGADAARTEQLLSDILDRIPARSDGEQSSPNDFYEAAGNLVAWLCVTAGSARAWARFDTWVDDLVRGDPFLWAMISSLRGALFLGYRSPVKLEDVALRGRAKRVLNRVIAAERALRGLPAYIQLPEDRRRHIPRVVTSFTARTRSLGCSVG